MSPSVLALVALLFGAFLVILALVVWQEARRRPSYEPLEYVVDDAVKHIEEGLAAEGNADLRRGDIRRILETGERPHTVRSAPAGGLCLMAVGYDHEERQTILTEHPTPPSF